MDRKAFMPRAAASTTRMNSARIVIAAAALCLLATCREAPAPPPSPVGLWGWHEQWESAPPDIVKETGPQWAARGIVLRFCPNGRFRMSTGVFYRWPWSIALGVSDGLTLFDGQWTQDAEGIVVRYRLVDAEIRWNGYDQALKRELIERPTFQNDALRFTYTNPMTLKRWRFRFIHGERMEAPLAARFAECAPPQ